MSPELSLASNPVSFSSTAADRTCGSKPNVWTSRNSFVAAGRAQKKQ